MKVGEPFLIFESSFRAFRALELSLLGIALSSRLSSLVVLTAKHNEKMNVKEQKALTDSIVESGLDMLDGLNRLSIPAKVKDVSLLIFVLLQAKVMNSAMPFIRESLLRILLAGGRSTLEQVVHQAGELTAHGRDNLISVRNRRTKGLLDYSRESVER